MLGTARPDLMGYTDPDLFARRGAHLDEGREIGSRDPTAGNQASLTCGPRSVLADGQGAQDLIGEAVH